MHIGYRFIEPLDVLFLRGNKLFGDPGSYGESLVPPWPSTIAGALRSQILSSDGVDVAAFARGDHVHPVLGTPVAPGPFTVASLDLARLDGRSQPEALHALPADIATFAPECDEPMHVVRMTPQTPPEGLSSSAPLPKWPVQAQRSRSKPQGSHWLTQGGWKQYLAGQAPDAWHLVSADSIWKLDQRVGIGLDVDARRAADGSLFSVQAVSFERGVGFLVGVLDGDPPREGILRLGGDGRGAAVRAVEYHMPEPPWDAIVDAGRCRIVLTAPTISPLGWRVPGSDADGKFMLGDVQARVVCAVVPGASVVSGWDLARQRPKPAVRAIPAGAVYWLEDLRAMPDQLRKLVTQGLWSRPDENPHRRAEGFNRFTFAVW